MGVYNVYSDTLDVQPRTIYEEALAPPPQELTTDVLRTRSVYVTAAGNWTVDTAALPPWVASVTPTSGFRNDYVLLTLNLTAVAASNATHVLGGVTVRQLAGPGVTPQAVLLNLEVVLVRPVLVYTPLFVDQYVAPSKRANVTLTLSNVGTGTLHWTLYFTPETGSGQLPQWAAIDGERFHSATGEVKEGQTTALTVVTSTFGVLPGEYATRLMLISNGGGDTGGVQSIEWTLRVTALILFPLVNLARLAPNADQDFNMVIVNMRSDAAVRLLFTATCYNFTEVLGPTQPWLRLPPTNQLFQVDALSTFNFRVTAQYAWVPQAVNATGLFPTCFRMLAFDADEVVDVNAVNVSAASDFRDVVVSLQTLEGPAHTTSTMAPSVVRGGVTGAPLPPPPSAPLFAPPPRRHCQYIPCAMGALRLCPLRE
jgi:hypothetical protein